MEIQDKIKGFGWRKQHPDQRDFKLAKLFRPEMPTQSVFLSDKYKMPKIVDQGNLGSCTGNGTGGIIMFDLLNNHDVNKVSEVFTFPSRLFLYYGGREKENSILSDAGAEIRDVIKTAAKQGVCSEETWPYMPERFSMRPTRYAYNKALQYKSLDYYSLDNTNPAELQTCLQQGFPFVLGFTVYASFEGIGPNGRMPIPSTSEYILGGHCVYCIGYDLQTDMYLCVNSWGPLWAAQGKFWMPAQVMNNADITGDCWMIKTVL